METLKCVRERECVSSYLGAYGRKDSYGMLRRNDVLILYESQVLVRVKIR